MSLHLTRLWWWLLGLAVGAVLAAVAFAIGLELGLKRGTALAQPEIATLLAERQSALAELAALHGEVSKLRQEASVMERSRQIERETNSDFGFCLSVWDRIFGTYIAEPERGQLGMVIGIEGYRADAEQRLDRLLVQPLK
jgi:hypothetical protein